MFSTSAILIGLLATFIIGLSKTALPGAALIAVPMIATIVEGRLVAGTVLPVLLVADCFAISWYRQFARWDLLRPLSTWIAVGFATGISFFVAVGAAEGAVETAIGVTILAVVAMQLSRMVRSTPVEPTATGARAYGVAGGFMTFVSNSAGPVMNSYLAGLRLSKQEMVGTAAWFYFAVNVSKIPFYLALGRWSDGGAFFTQQSLAYDAAIVPGVILGVLFGRKVFHRIPQRQFLLVVLVLSAVGGLKLII